MKAVTLQPVIWSVAIEIVADLELSYQVPLHCAGKLHIESEKIHIETIVTMSKKT